MRICQCFHLPAWTLCLLTLLTGCGGDGGGSAPLDFAAVPPLSTGERGDDVGDGSDPLPEPPEEENRRPVAVVGPDRGVSLFTLVMVDAGASFDPDGDPLAFDWALLAQPAGSQVVLSEADAAAVSFTPTVVGDYRLRLIVSDGRGGLASALVTVTTVAPGVNINPVAEAGADAFVEVQSVVELDGSASFDPDGTLLFFDWSLAGRPPGSFAILGAGTTAQAFFLPDVAGDYRVQLTVRDQRGASGTDTVVITALPPGANRPPVADAGGDLTALVGTRVLVDGRGSFDPEGAPLTFSWSLLPPAGSLALLDGDDTATPCFTADLVGQYRLVLTVRDLFGASAQDLLLIQVH